MKPAPDLRHRALRARYLHNQKITGEELAARLKCPLPNALALLAVGTLIESAEYSRLSKRERDVFKVICRVMARNVMTGTPDAKIAEVDFAAGKRTGWSGKSLTGLTIAGLIVSTVPGRLRLTNAGWAFAWESRLIKPSWKVPT